MQNYILMTDSDSDLPFALKEQFDIPVVYMPYVLEGKEYFDRCYNILAYLAVLAGGFNDTELASWIRERFNVLLE